MMRLPVEVHVRKLVGVVNRSNQKLKVAAQCQRMTKHRCGNVGMWHRLSTHHAMLPGRDNLTKFQLHKETFFPFGVLEPQSPDLNLVQHLWEDLSTSGSKPWWTAWSQKRQIKVQFWNCVGVLLFDPISRRPLPRPLPSWLGGFSSFLKCLGGVTWT